MKTDLHTPFEIISFTAGALRYYPASMERESWMTRHDVPYVDIDIPLGKSRYGGPVMDLPDGMEVPEDLPFAAQLDMAEIVPHDRSGLLPASGHLFFFADTRSDRCKVMYADVPNQALVRKVVEHDGDFFSGVLIDRVYADTEIWEERYQDPKDDWDHAHKNEAGKLWDYFGGSERSKVFGIYTHCQYQEEDIIAVTSSDKILLLQIGENGFNDEGVFSVLIPKEDLRALNFEHCTFTWGQS